MRWLGNRGDRPGHRSEPVPHNVPSYPSRLLAGIGLVTVVLLALGSTATAAPPNPSDAELQAADAAVASVADHVGDLIVRVAAADQALAELDASVAIKREDVNRALVDLRFARDAVDSAAHLVRVTEQALRDAGARITEAQNSFDDFARSSYTGGVNAASLSAFLSTDGPDDLLDRARIMRVLSNSRTAVLDALERARTAEANSNSRARAAKNEADAAVERAEQRQADAEAAIAQARAALDAQVVEKYRIEEQRAQAQTELDRARGHAAGLEGQRAEFDEWNRRREAEAAAAAEAATRQAAAEAAARVEADVEARARAAEVAESQRSHTDLDEPTGWQVTLGDPEVPADVETWDGPAAADVTVQDQATWDAPPANDADTGTETAGTLPTEPTPDSDTDYTGSGNDSGAETSGSDSTYDEDGTDEEWVNPDPADMVVAITPSEPRTTPRAPTTPRITPPTTTRPSVSGPAAVETVVDRAMSQIGVPYAWGGGDANGPTRGIRDGGVADVHGDYNKIGFDCSGLMIYAFAGVGISLPHYTGYQYTAGKQIPSSQMRRGDMIFWGPNASQHVALYLGDGMMLEAPQSGSHVKISPVRWGGMTPYAVRLVN